MKLSVIIPTYNEGENLFKTVQSVIALQDEIGDDGLNTETWTANRKRSAGMYVDLNDSWHCLWKNREDLSVLSENVYRTYAIPGESFAIRRDVYDAVGGVSVLASVLSWAYGMRTRTIRRFPCGR